MSRVLGAIILVFSVEFSWAKEVTIAALGDSLIQGYGLSIDGGFVPQLEAWLIDQGEEVTIINAGVSGDTTAGGLSRAAWTLSPNVNAIIVALGGNDLLRGIDPATSRANLAGILQQARDVKIPVLLIGMVAPNNYGTEYKKVFDVIYPELAFEYDVLYLDSFFSGLGGPGLDPAQIRQFLQADGIHPNAIGVTRIVEAIGPYVIDLISEIK